MKIIIGEYKEWKLDTEAMMFAYSGLKTEATSYAQFHKEVDRFRKITPESLSQEALHVMAKKAVEWKLIKKI